MKLLLHDGTIMDVPAYGYYGGIRIKSVELFYKDFKDTDKLIERLLEDIYPRMIIDE